MLGVCDPSVNLATQKLGSDERGGGRADEIRSFVDQRPIYRYGRGV